ncbi:MAG TPA: hypothetical protein VF765_24110 [Polyangiaceae bacterium]
MTARSHEPFSIGWAIQMTYDKAVKWLTKIGGTWTEEKHGQGEFLVVSVKSAKGATVSGRAQFGDSFGADRRDLEFQQAFVWACIELKRALA